MRGGEAWKCLAAWGRRSVEGGSPRVKGVGTGLQGDPIANLGSWAVHRGVPECHGFHGAGSGVWASDRPGGELACGPFARGVSSV